MGIIEKQDTYVYPYGNNLYINLTNRCCNRCTFCLREHMDGLGGYDLRLNKEPSAAEVIAAFDSFHGYEEAVFCGYGESTYRLAELAAVADHIKSKRLTTRLDTNGLGSRINGFDIVPYLAGRIDTVSVSLNQASPEAYNAISCPDMPDAFDSILTFASNCIRAGLCTVLTVVDVIPAADIAACAAIAKQLGAEFRVREYIR